MDRYLLGALFFLFALSFPVKADDSASIERALKKAEILLGEGATHVEVYFPKGAYHLDRREPIVIPSHVTLCGDPEGGSVILNKPREGNLFAFTTRTPQNRRIYLPIARADDPFHRIEETYKGKNFVYLANAGDVSLLRDLGVPSSPRKSFKGLRVVLASGATLSNNSNQAGGGIHEPPARQLELDPQINPAPSIMGVALCVTDDGKVTLKEPNPLNWGRDAHMEDESASRYSHPSPSEIRSWIISGPAWLIPAQGFHHDIRIRNLTFQTDPSEEDRLRYASALRLDSCYDVEVSYCRFEKMPGFYHILTVRGFDILIRENQFDVYGEQSVTFDSGSDLELNGNSFKGGSWPHAAELGIPPSAINFVNFDEEPISITIAKNRFVGLKNVKGFERKSGRAIFGTGGAGLRLIENHFEKIAGPLVELYFFSHGFVAHGNKVVDCPKAWDEPGLGLSIEKLESYSSKSKTASKGPRVTVEN